MSEPATKEDLAQLSRQMAKQHNQMLAGVKGLQDLGCQILEHLKAQQKWRLDQEAAANAAAPVEPGKFDEPVADKDRWDDLKQKTAG
jgi:hypothetical protein